MQRVHRVLEPLVAGEDDKRHGRVEGLGLAGKVQAVCVRKLNVGNHEVEGPCRQSLRACSAVGGNNDIAAAGVLKGCSDQFGSGCVVFDDERYWLHCFEAWFHESNLRLAGLTTVSPRSRNGQDLSQRA